jgi:hypothetical protein
MSAQELVTFIALIDPETHHKIGRYCPSTGDLVIFKRQRDARFNLHRLTAAVKIDTTPCDSQGAMLESE